MTGPQRAEQLLDVAEALFVGQGYDATSIEDIARDAGVTRPIVYQHHGSKGGVYLACVERARRQLIESSAGALVGVDDPVGALARAADVWFREVERDPRRWELLHTDQVVTLDPELRSVKLPSTLPFYAGAIASWARPDVAAERISAAAQMAIGAAVELARWWIHHPHVARADIVDQLVEFCWRGLSTLLPAEWGELSSSGVARPA